MAGLRRWRAIILVVSVWIVGAWYMLGPPGSFDIPFAVPGSPRTRPLELDNSIRWRKQPDRYPLTSFTPLPTNKPVAKIPSIQATRPQEDTAGRSQRLQRLAAVKESFRHCWEGYKQHAWLRDEVAPVTGRAKDPFGGWAATLVDALDTLWIMDMKSDFKSAVKACDKIDFGVSAGRDINVFETTIRYLGGFLASYELSGKRYSSLLKKAVEVGDLLMSAFDTPNRLPITRWDWAECAAPI
jgi:mannosyl-oligosaccharide alpha-1,2-mannosidase